jgi:predicted dehydrogenase/threonine dehydrogenase-like Zn-dependent dehydrogenase
MKQILRKGLKEIIVDEVPDPVATAHHILVRPLYSLISSGTETASIHQEGVLKALADNPSHLQRIWRAVQSQGPISTFSEVRAKLKEYAVLGYAGAGVVVDKHPSVATFEIGDRVAYGGEGTGHGETILVGEKLAVKIPPGVAAEHACFTTLGSIALNGVRIARLQGASVLAIDLKPQRVELAHRLGADHALLASPSLPPQVESITGGRGVDCVIIAAAAKSSAPCEQAVEICRDRGRIVDVGAVELAFPWYQMYLKEIRFFMARAYGPGSYDANYEKKGQDYPLAYVRWTENRNMAEFLRLVSMGRVQLQPLITHEFALEDAATAYQTIMDPAAGSLAVVLNYPAAKSDDPVGEFVPRRTVAVQTSPASAGKLGFALVGAGNLARWVHLPALKKVSGAELRAICSASGARGKSYALRFGGQYCTSDYDEVLRDPDVKVVVIVSRNQQHAPQALAALRAGKHVFLEKPMAITEPECRELFQAVQESGCQLTVGFNRRFSPSYLALKKQLASRSGPAVLNCRINSPGISGDYWMADPAIGGAILGEACHFVDLMYWLLESEPVAVSAFSLPTGRQSPIGENNLTATFRFADGSVGNLTYCTVGSQTSGGERVEVFAPGLGAWAEDFKKVTVQTSLVQKRSRLFAEKGYREQMNAFFEALREGKPPMVTARDGTRATIGCLRMLESAKNLAVTEINVETALA